MSAAAPAPYGAAVRRLVDEARAAALPRTLAFAAPRAAARARLAALTDADLADGRPVRDPRAAAAARAGLWLLHDHMTEGHEICQDLDTPSGSFWHMIVHRREPDPGNARYWCAHLGAHDVFDELLAGARRLAGRDPPEALRPLLGAASWRPERFVALCTGGAAAAGLEPLLLEIQRLEWRLLFDYDFRAAFGA
jgi:hypothetical protein